MNSSRGFIVISTVFLLLAVAVMIGVTVTMFSVSDSGVSFALSRGAGARALLDGCVEDALLFSRASAAYAGGTIVRPEGSCTANIAKAGNRWTATVRVSGAFGAAAEVAFDRTGSGVRMVRWRAIP